MIATLTRNSAGFSLLIVVFMVSVTRGEGWPAYRHDISRSAISSESLTLPLKASWKYESAQPPSPAWPPPHFILLNRLDFDYAPQPVVDNGIVCFGSTTDDTVRAIDLVTGKLRWRFIAGGPVRLAPQIYDGRVYFGSDDGCAYCVNAADGRVVWKFNAAPHEEQFLGNGRMISRWPIRTGVLVDNGVAHFAAGMWATEGIFVFALDAKSGQVIWCNDTCGYAGVDYNKLLTPENVGEMRHGVHDGDFGVYGLTPQGALAVTQDVLLIPNGYNSPAGLDRKTGRLLFADPQAGTGGHWLTAEGDAYYAKYRHRNNRILIMKRDARTGERLHMQYRSVHNLTPVPRVGVEHLHHEVGKSSVLMLNGRAISRNAYSMVMAGGMMVLGQGGHVAIVDHESNEELWRAEVDGKAYELAVADGCLLVGTDRGTVYCFGNQTSVEKPPIAQSKFVITMRDAPPPLLNTLAAAGMDRGYALVLGDNFGDLSQSLSRHSDLKIVTVLADEKAAMKLRERLVKTTDLYGSRIHVQHQSSRSQLPFAQHFANAVIVADRSSLKSSEFFRVLRPCGGMMCFVGSGRFEYGRVCRDLADRLKSNEAEQLDDSLQAIVRGQLPGSLDWNSDYRTDKLARWPLRPLWFGGPSSAQVTDFKNGNARPPAAYGRYFVMGEDTLTAVDAYNGSILWSRPIPGRSPDLRKTNGLLHYTERVWSRELRDAHNRSVRVNDRQIYLYLADGNFRGAGRGCVVLDARTGKQEAIFGPNQPSPHLSLDESKSWSLNADDAHKGTLKLAKSDDGITIQIQTTDPVVTRLDEWDLFFDFRPMGKRYGLYESSVFHIRVIPPLSAESSPTWLLETGTNCPRFALEGKATPNGFEATLALSWEEVRRVTGRDAESFGFAAAMNSHDGSADERIKQRFLFCDHAATGINNGWANVFLNEIPATTVMPNVIAGGFDELPKVRMAIPWAPSIDPQVSEKLRVHPLTGELGPRIFRSGTGTCGGFDFSATSVIKRSGAAKVLGIYDFVEDSGLHTIVGISAGCAPTTTTALGMVIASESKARCVCTFPFRTSVALAPNQRRLNEDWAIFYDRDVDTQVRQAAINLGAFGDRRDAGGTMWLGFPRRVDRSQALGYAKLPGSKIEAFLPGVWPIARSANLDLPLDVECYEGGGPFQLNSDRTTIAGTDRPWLYASGYRGIRRATLRLDFLKPLAAKSLDRSPMLDGQLVGNEWPPEPQIKLAGAKADIFLAYDDQHLYVAARQAASFDRRGKVQWTGKTSGDDAEVWTDNSCEVFLSDQAGVTVAHFGVSLTGARYDALAKPNTLESSDWNGDWQSSAAFDDKAFVTEMAIPWTTLDDVGLNRNKLAINVMMNRTAKMGEALTYLGSKGRTRCSNFTPLGLNVVPKVAPRRFQVKLHFAELHDANAGQREFAVILNGNAVLENLDVRRESANANTAVIRKFSNVVCAESLIVEFPTNVSTNDLDRLPILCAIEVREEGFQIPATSARK